MIMRIKVPDKFGKLEARKKTCGEKTGFAIHFVGYSVIPMIRESYSLLWAFKVNRFEWNAKQKNDEAQKIGKQFMIFRLHGEELECP